MIDLFQGAYNKWQWCRWTYPSGNLLSLRESCCPIPPKYGVYIIRAPQPLNRVKSSSDVVYIGQSGDKKREQTIGPVYGPRGGLQKRGRLLNTRGRDAQVREMIEKLYPQSKFIVECYFTNQGENPKTIEIELLSAYLETHYELPPANHKLG
jgi:hypothetical protein